uniref:Small toxic polypeptide LdrD bacterial toxin TA type n=1 Tax=Siphoviridae sp. ct8NQ14 TaxID=2825363 RepID=A0A8S5PLR4_9CAUD|nr:MAG TPA: Small toxic polypeptide LdrD bacterial toxin TA type [Siphoviridae sp. ct8NQ14]
MIEKIKFFLQDVAIPIIGGVVGSFIGMGIAKLLGIL